MGKNPLKERVDEIEKLVLLTQKGDQEAFSALYDIFIDPIYRYVYYRVDKRDVEDLVENIFLKVWENIRKYKPGKKLFVAWVFKISHNLVVDYYRAAKNHKYEELSPNLQDHDRMHNPIKVTQNSLDHKMLKEAIAQLKKPYREVIVQKFINGLSNKEISRILRKTEGNLRILQFRALKHLRQILEDMGISYKL